jgi:hypothetical protein
MKKLVVSLIAGSLFTLSSGVMAEGSKIEKSTITNLTTNTNAINAAIGSRSTANLGSVNIKNSEVKNSTLTNLSTNSNVINAAIGSRSTANTGSVNVE